MSDPRRWLDQLDPELSVERELLSVGKRLNPPPGAADRGWSGVAASLGRGPTDPTGGGGAAPGPDGAGSALGGSSAGTSAISAGTLKAFLLGAALGVGVMGVVQLARVGGPDEAHRDVHELAAPPREATAVVAPAAEQQVAPREPSLVSSTPLRRTLAPVAARAPSTRISAAPEPEPQPSAAARVVAPASSSDDPPPVPPALSAEPVASAPAAADGLGGGLPGGAGPPKKPSQNSLQVEALELARAKNLLAAGRAADALALLEHSTLLFAAGSLVPEREALTIEALLQNGQSQRARERARTFVQRYPNSPISERLRRLEGKP